jgi:hypothetical protein
MCGSRLSWHSVVDLIRDLEGQRGVDGNLPRCSVERYPAIKAKKRLGVRMI